MAAQPIYKLEQVQPSDLEEIARLENTVFDDDPLVVYAYGPTRASPKNIASRVKSLSSGPNGCTVRMRKVVDPETGAIIGFSQWKYYYEPWIVNPVTEKEEETVVKEVKVAGAPDQEEQSSSIWPEGANVDLCEKAFIGGDKIREREFAGKKHVVLNTLVILKSHQRRGIGKMMMKDGLDEADKHNLPGWLGASEQALKLYKNNGFVVNEVMHFNMRPYGGYTDEKHIIMFRPAMGKTES